MLLASAIAGSRQDLSRRAYLLSDAAAVLDQTQVKSDISIRQRILDAALDIVEKNGVTALTQPRVAKAAGVRQSHLTYYFPKKADLFVALLQASHARAGDAAHGQAHGHMSFDDAMKALRALVLDPLRMRFFLGIVVEAGEAGNLQPILAEHARALVFQVAPHFGRAGDDPDVTDFVDALRGLGVRMLIDPDSKLMRSFDPVSYAAKFGLKRT